MRISRCLATLLVPCVLGCGGAEPHYRQRTAAEWAADVWDSSPDVGGRAIKALREFSATHPQLVTEALGVELTRPRPAPSATPFSIRLDVPGATRLGLEPLTAPDALERDLELLRRRIVAAGIELISLRGDATGEVDVLLAGERPRKEAERLQRFLCRRGALDLRAIVIRPTGPASDADAFTAWFETERLRLEEAEKAGAVYRPSRPDRRLARTEPAAGDASPDRFLALEEPATAEDVFDERVVERARGFIDKSGRGRVRLDVLSARRAPLAKWSATLVGREVAVLRDGVVVERMAVTKPWKNAIEVAAAGEAGEASDELRRAREDAATIGTGRIPRPLMPIPIDATFGADPLPENRVSRVMLELGVISIPSLERVEKDPSAPAWSRKSATWALAEIRKFEAEKSK